MSAAKGLHIGLMALIALLAGALLWAAFFWQPQPPQPSAAPDQDLPPGTLDLRLAAMGGPFTLDSADGAVTLDDLRGKVVLIYFGYTFCPDACPTNLAIMAAGFSQMSEEELAQVQGVFVSVDPDRDTLERLKQYTGYFHPRIMGVTGTAEQLAGVARRYGASYQIGVAKTAGGYLVDHSSYIHVVDQQGNLLFALPHAVAPELMVETIRTLLNTDR
ncbi:MAG: SCO family protein [Proteobacteria bacterium]|nr:MAG: SCO family protein [Pseudomonadota bacterium]QKK11300.1 MAG: SCO family protein [Pseudomonadota bacterium]